jgi:hypothetical protein
VVCTVSSKIDYLFVRYIYLGRSSHTREGTPTTTTATSTGRAVTATVACCWCLHATGRRCGASTACTSCGAVGDSGAWWTKEADEAGEEEAKASIKAAGGVERCDGGPFPRRSSKLVGGVSKIYLKYNIFFQLY